MKINTSKLTNIRLAGLNELDIRESYSDAYIESADQWITVGKLPGGLPKAIHGRGFKWLKPLTEEECEQITEDNRDFIADLVNKEIF